MTRKPDGKLHFSNLKAMARTPQHYVAQRDGLRKQTRSMATGSLVHAIVLGGQYTVYDGERRGNAWKEFLAEHAEEFIVTASEFEAAMRAAKGIARNLSTITLRDGRCASCLLDGLKEREIDWTFRGTPARSTPDIINTGRVVDLKTASSADIRMFQYRAGDLSYHAQLAFYRLACVADGHASNPEDLSAYLVAAETEPPYGVSVHKSTERRLKAGLMSCVAWHERLLECERSNHWPTYSQTDVDWDLESERIEFDDEEDTDV